MLKTKTLLPTQKIILTNLDRYLLIFCNIKFKNENNKIIENMKTRLPQIWIT